MMPDVSVPVTATISAPIPVTASTAAIATSTVSATAAATRPIITGFGLIDSQGAPPHLRAIERGDRRIRICVRHHLHESKALSLARVTVRNNAHLFHGASRGKQV